MYLIRGDVDRAQKVSDNLKLPAVPLVRADAITAVDYVLSEEDRIGLGSLGQKFSDNFAAIKLVKQLQSERRHAIADEQRTLARYVGWGGLKGVFDSENKQWSKQHQALRGLLSDTEWSAASRSVLDAFYTAPVVANGMYSALDRLGFKGGVTLDPSVGVGNFFGCMPKEMREGSTLHGVELDILTSQIVEALYPKAKIAKATGFEDYRVPAGYFDLVIGNPPFGSQAVVDEAGSVYSGWSIHNYFFAKSIDMLRPGGVMSMVVSHNFLDKLDPHVRQWIARRADLVSGVRLPDTAFKENANTEVVTDILIFQRRNDLELGRTEEPDWLNTTEIQLVNPDDGETYPHSVNNYFINNPERVLGNQSAAGGMYSGGNYTVTPNGELADQLQSWVDTLPAGIYTAVDRTALIEQQNDIDVPDGIKEGSFFLLEDGQVGLRLPDMLGKTRAVVWTPPNAKALDRMKHMIQIRTTLRQQMALERSHDASDIAIENGRDALNKIYDSFQQKYGYLNDPLNRRLFMDDTESALVQALEFDYEKAITATKAQELGMEERAASARKADIFSQRVLFPPIDIAKVETAKDALLHSLNQYGRVNIAYMTGAYGKGEQETLAELEGVVYRDPVRDLVTADEYLSGDVKTKLAEARKAAQNNLVFEKNVRALEAVIPKDKMPSEIFASIGAIWIPPDVYSAFAKEISGASIEYSNLKSAGQWFAGTKSAVNYVLNNTEFGTDKLGALDIFFQTMNGRGVEVKKLTVIDGKERYVTDEESTEAARQKADKIRTTWDSWIWRDSARTDRLMQIYNDGFNRTVERQYDGSHLTFPGMNPLVTLLAHQKNGVWRGIQDRNTLLDQVVGAGKTFEMVTMAMEMRRLGISRKPMLSVPNHLTLQWRSEFYRLYPGANVLAATPADFEKDNREKLFSKIVTGNWDAVIVGHSSLKKIALPADVEHKIFEEQLDEIVDAVEAMKRNRGDRSIIRDMEKIKSNLEAKLKLIKEKGGKKDKVVDFADLGVDGLMIDELHEFKNLFFYTQMQRVAGLGNPTGSGKAMDLFMKTRWLKETYGVDAPLITATGTPVSNSLAEMFTMQRYMQYEYLKDKGLHNFDSWVKQYGDVQTVYEVAPSGTGYRLSQRFAKFKNLPSLMGSYRSFADVVTLDDLKAQEAARGRRFPVPRIAGGRPQNVVVPRSELQEKFFGVPELQRNESGAPVFDIDLDKPVSIEPDGERWKLKSEYSVAFYGTKEEAEIGLVVGATTPKMHIDPKSIVGQFENLREITRRTKGKINALSLTSLAVKAGLDYRLIDPSAPDHEGSKINVAIGHMMENYHKWNSDKGTQLVFCDLSVPLSAKSKMAANEKRSYVRSAEGAVTHKRGTLHKVRDYEGFPFFLVQDGKGKDKTFSMYDPKTGQLLRDGFDGKTEAQDWAKRFLEQDGGQEKWLDLREQAPDITVDEIDEYKNERGLNDDGESVDNEFTPEDIEGVTGPSDFSVYDDIKAKLIRNGIPENEIQFIHDFDTPQAKEALFKRVKRGDVRFLLGSTPKMGAGTNVQDLLVAQHHIDAPQRPSDLEQRDGRIVRRGNKLYERDPDGFEVSIYRYATSQTYDTRRWQLLEHKAAGIQQLRNYSGESEIEDVASEASNAADMKAAASGNPLILKETQLATEVKKLKALSNAHLDGEWAKRNRVAHHRAWQNTFGPRNQARIESLIAIRDKTPTFMRYQGKTADSREDAIVILEDVRKTLQSSDAQREIVFKGMKFVIGLNAWGTPSMTTPDEENFELNPFSPSGVCTRLENYADKLDGRVLSIKQQIADEAHKADELEKTLGKPFEFAEQYQDRIAEHRKVQRALMKANSLAAVKPEEMAWFEASVASQRSKLVDLGYGQALREVMAGEDNSIVVDGVLSANVIKDVVPSEPEDVRKNRLLAEPIVIREHVEIAKGGMHWGRVDAIENGYLYLDVGRGVVKAHAIAGLETIPHLNRFARLNYEAEKIVVSVVGPHTEIAR